MTFKDWDEGLKYLEALTKWPPVILYLALLFRKAIAEKLSGLESVKVKDFEVIFSVLKKVAAESKNPAFVQQLVLKLLPDSLTKGEPKSDKPEADKSSDEEGEGVEEESEDQNALETEREEIERTIRQARE